MRDMRHRIRTAPSVAAMLVAGHAVASAHHSCRVEFDINEHHETFLSCEVISGRILRAAHLIVWKTP
jgi:hypothetical protein